VKGDNVASESNTNFESSRRVRINYCSISELLTLPGIGHKRAQNIVAHRKSNGPFLTVEDLESVSSLTPAVVDSILSRLEWSFNGYYIPEPESILGDARSICGVEKQTIDLIVTSPPYWKKRDYGHPNQLGQEETPSEYVEALVSTVNSWIPFLRPHASVFLNVGDTYRDSALVGIPDLLAIALRDSGWLIVNRIVWAKDNGTPEPLDYRLASRHEVIFQLARGRGYFSDVNSLARYLGKSANPGDVWQIPTSRSSSSHLAPYPDELVGRIVEFACPQHVCTQCGRAYALQYEATTEVDMTRPQARRALELFQMAGLTEEHAKAIRAVGISDSGKAKRIQSGSENNARRVKELALEAKSALGGYFREFTFASRMQAGWRICGCHAATMPGMVLDPFMGSGTTLRVAHQLGRLAVGVDLVLP
jgi:competence ComEA-like helix-hairpin-helix protein